MTATLPRLLLASSSSCYFATPGGKEPFMNCKGAACLANAACTAPVSWWEHGTVQRGIRSSLVTKKRPESERERESVSVRTQRPVSMWPHFLAGRGVGPPDWQAREETWVWVQRYDAVGCWEAGCWAFFSVPASSSMFARIGTYNPQFPGWILCY